MGCPCPIHCLPDEYAEAQQALGCSNAALGMALAHGF